MKQLYRFLNNRNYSNLGMQRVKTAARMLELITPFKVIHVLGTNGKGSVANYLYCGFKACNLSVGLFTSPVTTTFLACYKMSNIDVTNEIMLKAFNTLVPIINHFDKLNNNLTKFEIEFLISLVMFKQHNIKYIILEAGMGGVGDASNIFDAKLVNVFTSISCDHLNIIGKDVYEIFDNKTGVINNNDCLSAFYPLSEKLTVYAKSKLASKKNIYILDSNEIEKHIINNKLSLADYEINLKMPGHYQMYNYYLAYFTFNKLLASNLIPTCDLKTYLLGSMQAQIPLRLEELYPNLYLDAAHNVDACTNLVSFFNQEEFKDKSKLILFGAYHDKEYKKMYQILNTLTANIMLVKITDNKKRALRKKALIELYNISNNKFHQVLIDTKINYKLISKLRQKYDVIIICGSLGMNKIIRHNLINKK